MQINVPAFSPEDLVSAPQGATHFRLTAMGAAIDFQANTYSLAGSETGYLAVSNRRQPELSLSHTVPGGSTHPLFLVLGIEFAQLNNGIQYPLANSTLNAMAIARVDNAGTLEAHPQAKDVKPKQIPLVRRRNQSSIGFLIRRQRAPLPSAVSDVFEDQWRADSRQCGRPKARSPAELPVCGLNLTLVTQPSRPSKIRAPAV